MWFVLIDGAWVSEGIVAALSLLQWGRAEQSGSLLTSPQHLRHLESQSACAVVGRRLPTSPLHDLQCLARDTWGCWVLWPELTLYFSRLQLPFWLATRPLLSLILHCFPGAWLWLWHRRSLGSSLQGGLLFCPSPSCTTSSPESQLVSVLSSVQEVSQASCQAIEDPWLAGKGMDKLWFCRTSCSLVSSNMTIFNLGLAWVV